MKSLVVGICCLVVGILLAVGPLESVNAHALGRQQLERVEAGPYRITAWTDPLEPDTGRQLHLTIAVEDNSGLVLNAKIEVEAVHRQSGKKLLSVASHEDAINKLYYEAKFEPKDVGDWDFTISVEKDGEVGEAGFALKVAKGGRNLPIGWIGAGIVGVLIVGLVIFNRLPTSKRK